MPGKLLLLGREVIFFAIAEKKCQCPWQDDFEAEFVCFLYGILFSLPLGKRDIMNFCTKFSSIVVLVIQQNLDQMTNRSFYQGLHLGQ
jgi:hypothetical protein